MTVKMSVSVPDDVAAYLQAAGNASSAVTDAVRRVMPQARRDRQRAAARNMATFRAGQNARDRQAERDLIEDDNDVALRGTEW